MEAIAYRIKDSSEEIVAEGIVESIYSPLFLSDVVIGAYYETELRHFRNILGYSLEYQAFDIPFEAIKPYVIGKQNF